MKTDDLIGLLAQGAGRTEPAGDLGHMVLGALMVLPLMVLAVWLGLGLVPVALWPVSGTFAKLSYAGIVLFGAGLLLRRLGRPGAAVGLPLALIAGTLAAVAMIGVADLLRQPVAGWPMHILGKSAPVCPWAILFLSVPVLAVMLWSARALAPTRLRLAGAAAGLAAGALGALAYAMGCDEGALTFMALWYSLGMALATVLGAVVGPRVLRW